MTTFTTQQHSSAQKFLKVQGVLSVVLGGLGVLILTALIPLLIWVLGSPDLLAEADSTSEDMIGTLIVVILSIPASIFFVISGIILLRKPRPGVAKGLSITNVVVAALSGNYLILAFAIVSLVQSPAYADGYKANKN